MKKNICKGDTVRHKVKHVWGIGKVVDVQRCGTIQVIFEGERYLSFAKGAQYLVKIA